MIYQHPCIASTEIKVLSCILSRVVLKVMARGTRVELHWIHQTDGYTLRNL